MVAYYTPADPVQEQVPACPFCSSHDHVQRPLVRYLKLLDGALTTSWHCEHCQATYTFPDPASERPMRFGESRLA